jgi:signal transduction histidine kinase
VVRDGIERAIRGLDGCAQEDVVVDVPANLAVLADRRALVGVVAILVENAVKYGRPPVHISAEHAGGPVVLRVRDEGPGIEAHHHDRIFDPFYRVDVDMRSGVGGAGLGLFTARKLVDAMKGIIRVSSSPDAGCTFIVELPADTDVEVDPDEAETGRKLRLIG